MSFEITVLKQQGHKEIHGLIQRTTKKICQHFVFCIASLNYLRVSIFPQCNLPSLVFWEQMLLSFELPSFLFWGQEVRLMYSMWWYLLSWWNKHKLFRTLGRDANLHMAQSWGMLISSSLYFEASFWTLLKKIVFVLIFSLLFFIWLIAVSAFYCINLAEWIQGVSDSTFIWANEKTRQFQIVILAHYSSLMYTAFEFHATEIHI